MESVKLVLNAEPAAALALKGMLGIPDEVALYSDPSGAAGLKFGEWHPIDRQSPTHTGEWHIPLLTATPRLVQAWGEAGDPKTLPSHRM